MKCQYCGETLTDYREVPSPIILDTILALVYDCPKCSLQTIFDQRHRLPPLEGVKEISFNWVIFFIVMSYLIVAFIGYLFG